MKLLVVSLLLGTSLVALSKEYKNGDVLQMAETMSNAYYSGCMGGIVAIHELGYRNKVDEGVEGFDKLKTHCQQQSWDYFHMLTK